MRGRIRPLIAAIAAIAALAALGSFPDAAQAAAARAAPISRAAASQNSASAAPGSSALSCDFALEAYYYDTWLNTTSNLAFTFHAPIISDHFCQVLITSGGNVQIYDTSYADTYYCLAYSAATKHVYLHPNCSTLNVPSYEQWKFLPVNGGEGLYLLESGYEINGGYYCMEEDGANTPPMGKCSPENHQAVLFYSDLSG